MRLSYEKVRKIHRLEQSISSLSRLDLDFFEQIDEFVLEEMQKIKANQDIFDDKGIRNLHNIRKMIEDILQLRQTKIINLAVASAKSNEVTLDNMLTNERKMFEDITKIVKSYLSLSNFSDKKEKKKVSEVSVKILKSVPKFIGTDMNEYGPYSENDVVSIPENIAKLLTIKEIAKYE